MRLGKGTEFIPCSCVLRAIFSACFSRFVQSVQKDKGVSAVKLERISGPKSHMMYGRKTEEYIADFIGIAKRTLGTDSFAYALFRAHYLLGADSRLCQRYLGIDQGTFFRQIYQIEIRLGRAFRETEPYGLYPLDEYFSGSVKGKATTPCHIPNPQSRAVRPPLAQIQEAA